MFEIILAYILLGSLGSMLMFIWFNTDAFVEYMQLLRLDEYLYISEYNTIRVDDPSLSYQFYIASNYPSFFSRLFNCPKCLNIWVSVLINLPIFFTLAVLYSCLLFILIPFSVLITSYFSLSMYYLLVKLMKP